MTTETPIDIGSLIESTPGIQGGRPCIAGTAITILTVAEMWQNGLTVEQMVQSYPHVPLSHMHAAVAYYLANRALVNAELQREAEEYDRAMTEHYAQKPD